MSTDRPTVAQLPYQGGARNYQGEPEPDQRPPQPYYGQQGPNHHAANYNNHYNQPPVVVVLQDAAPYELITQRLRSVWVSWAILVGLAFLLLAIGSANPDDGCFEVTFITNATLPISESQFIKIPYARTGRFGFRGWKMDGSDEVYDLSLWSSTLKSRGSFFAFSLFFGWIMCLTTTVLCTMLLMQKYRRHLRGMHVAASFCFSVAGLFLVIGEGAFVGTFNDMIDDPGERLFHVTTQEYSNRVTIASASAAFFMILAACILSIVSSCRRDMSVVTYQAYALQEMEGRQQHQQQPQQHP